MKILIKILSFLFLIILISFAGWKFGREIKKGADFGNEYLGFSKNELFEKFGNPDRIESKYMYEVGEVFQSTFEDFINDCNSSNKIIYVFYEGFWFDYNFWLIEKNNEDVVIFVN